MANLYIVRGLPGSGKSTLVEALADSMFDPALNVASFEADMFMPEPFDPKKIGEAHAACQEHVKSAMCMGRYTIFVSNTFTQDWEMQPYLDMAAAYGYRVFTIVVENRHGGKSIHNVPEATIDRMRQRFQIKL